jgi:hypothetical protein
MRDLCLWLSAVDRNVLESCPEEEPRFVGAGGAVLTTSAMAFVAGSFAARGLLHLELVVSVVFGLGWALVIMNLERYLQASIRRQATPMGTVASALPRLALAVLLGLVITPFLLLVVFQTEDRIQVTVDRNEKLAHAREALEHQYASVPRLERQVATAEDDLSTPAPVGKTLQTSPEYQALARRYGRFRSEARSATSPAAAQANDRAANDTLQELEPLRAKLLAEEEKDDAVARTERQQQLLEARRQLTPLQAKLQAKRTELEKRYREPTGLADQLEAMSVLTRRNATVRWEKDILLLFIIAVDTIPALLKMLMLLGRPTIYEQVLEHVESASVTEVRLSEDLRAKEAELDAEQQLQIQRAVGEARVTAQVAAQQEWDETTLQTLRETLKPHLTEWARASAESYAAALREDIESQNGRARSARPPVRERPPSFPSLRARPARSDRRH